MNRRLTCLFVGHTTGGRIRALPSGNGRYEAWHTCPRCAAEHKVSQPGGLLVRTVQLADVIPRGYGLAWVHWNRPQAVCMPIPLNLVAGALRRAWHCVKVPRVLVDDPRAAYQQGLREGRRQQAEMDRFYSSQIGKPWEPGDGS